MKGNISVIGIGRLGLCVALCLESRGYSVLGVDISQEYINSINNKTLKSYEPLVEQYLRENKSFSATTSLDEALIFSDILLVYVPTPSGQKSYDHSILSRLLSSINKRRVQNKHVIIGCTVMPGYIVQIGNFLLQDCKNTSLSYNPEFIAQGNIMYGLFNPDLVLIGEGNKEAGDRLDEIYKEIAPLAKIFRMSPQSAEITKLAINCFVTTKIAFANMVGDIADKTANADKFNILKAVGADSRIGIKYLNPGYGYGGPCFPRDNRALGYYAQQIGIDPLIPVATDTSNALHTELQIKALRESGVSEFIFEDVGYKENCSVPIIEESQKLVIAETLARENYSVTIYDYEHIISEVQREYGNLFWYKIKIG